VVLLTRVPFLYKITHLHWYYLGIPISSLISVGGATYLVYANQDRFETQERRYAFGYCLFLVLITAYSWLFVVATRLLGKELYKGPGFLKPFFGRSARAQWSSKRMQVQGALAFGAALFAAVASLGSLFDKSRLVRYASALFWLFFSWHCYQLIKQSAWKAFGAAFFAGILFFVVTEWYLLKTRKKG